MYILSREPNRFVQQRATREPEPELVPEKKSLWGRFWSKAKEIGRNICNGVKDFWESLSGILVPVAAVVASGDTITKSGKGVYNRFSKKSELKPRKNTRKRQLAYVEVGALA
jgi:hypothetical protein